MAGPGAAVSFYSDLDKLPHFNPDLDTENPPAAVLAFRKELAESDGLVISSPEYAHGVPGTLKNALDWIVSSAELIDKPVLLIHASTEGGLRIQAQLTEIFRTMSARVLTGPPLFAATARKAFDDEGRVLDSQVAQSLQTSLNFLMEAINTKRKTV